MAFSVTHRYGAMTSNPPLSALPALLDELNDRPEDEEHGSVAVKHESEWCLSTSRSGCLIWENVECKDSKPRHMPDAAREEILRLWEALAKGEIDLINAEPWRPGYE
jgi:hypothetical protein